MVQVQRGDILDIVGAGGALTATPKDQVRFIDVDVIDPNPAQPRRDFEEEDLAELAQSIEHYGLLNPISVTQREGTRFELLQGERRLRAYKLLKEKGLAKFNTIPAIVRQVADGQKRILALIENTARTDLTILEMADCMAKLKTELGSTNAVVAAIKKSQAIIYRYVRIGEAPDFLRAIIDEKKYTIRQAEALFEAWENAEKEGLDPVGFKEQWEKNPSYPAAAKASSQAGALNAEITAAVEKPDRKSTTKTPSTFWQTDKEVGLSLCYKKKMSITAKDKIFYVKQIKKFLDAIGVKKSDIRP